ncbi:hypothetical protein VSDG_04123 [Cytospora chrysosperma]|uniref:Cytochrome P450 monooxygenase n=1 Tax=Cytospora chrysosperma TaxID=252740 RepID=A0A423W0X9_CYTCH|nr:hypothetical protein VSDG_04123 [Valsa sordida]
MNMANLSQSSMGAIVWALGAVIGVFALQCVYNLFFHPLRKFPGPVSHRAHIFPSVISLLRGKWNRELLPMAEKYGPVMRVLPNELVFTDPDALKDIYGHKNGAIVKGEEFEKSELFYRNRGIPPSILSETRDNHALLRRQLSHGFSEKSMREQEPIIKQYTDLLMIRLKEKCALASEAGGEKESLAQSKAVVDLRDWYTFTTFDVIGDLALGEPFGCLEKGEKNERVKTIEGGIASQNIGFAVRTMGLDRFFSLLAKGMTRFQQEMMEYMAGSLKRRIGLKVERPDFIEGLLKKQKDWNISFDILQTNAAILVIAGSETTATLLSGVTYLLLSNPECLRKATQEVRSTFEAEEEINFSSVHQLTYMLACLKEAMRCYPPVPSALPRVVPKGGAHVAGHFVPEGSVVSVSHYAMFHNSKNFSDPFSFKPERFIEPEKFPNDKIDAVQPFSVGPRDCIGKNLAYAEMRTILARMLFNFDLELAEPEKDWMDQQITSLWVKDALNVRLTPVQGHQ